MHPPAPVSLFDSLPVAVSLALLPDLAAAAAAAAGSAAVGAVQRAAGLAHLAAVVQGGTRVGPLQPVFFQEMGLKCSQVLHAALDFSAQQHDVGAVSCFLQQREGASGPGIGRRRAGPRLPSHLKLQILVSEAVLLQLAPFHLAVRRVGTQLSQLRGESFEPSFVGSDLLLLERTQFTVTRGGKTLNVVFFPLPAS